MNVTWHREHVLGRGATLAERVAWHRAHQTHCGCRPIPKSVLAALAARPARAAVERRRGKQARASETQKAGRTPSRTLARLVEALADEPGVTFGGRGFGARGLKVDGKLFAMLGRNDELIMKLPAERVARMIAARQGRACETQPGRPMRAWIVVDLPPARALALARDALAFVRDGR